MKCDREKVAQIEKELGMPPQLEYVREIYGMSGTAQLYRFGADWFVLSTVHIPQLVQAGLSGPWETYAFRSDSLGRIRDWTEVAGARGVDMYLTRGEARVRLEAYVQGVSDE